MNKDEKSKIVSDSELSLISAISGLDNKLEELDHNLAMMTKSGKEFSMPNINENEMNKKILDLEEKLTVLDQKISEKNLIPKNDKYINTIPSKSRIGPIRKGYALAENLRLKRIDTLEKQLINHWVFLKCNFTKLILLNFLFFNSVRATFTCVDPLGM